MCGDGSDLYAFDQRRPTPREWAALRKRIIARAHEERRQVIRQMVGATCGGIRRVWRARHRLVDAFQKASGPYLARRKRLQELRELSEMSDIELRDIGISRLEIRAAMRSNAKFDMSTHLKSPSRVVMPDPGIPTYPTPGFRLLAWTLFAGILVAVAIYAVVVAPAPDVDTLMSVIGP
jgi:uncharacterized protein YjiS (DUF1127 family)